MAYSRRSTSTSTCALHCLPVVHWLSIALPFLSVCRCMSVVLLLQLDGWAAIVRHYLPLSRCCLGAFCIALATQQPTLCLKDFRDCVSPADGFDLWSQALVPLSANHDATRRWERAQHGAIIPSIILVHRCVPTLGPFTQTSRVHATRWRHSLYPRRLVSCHTQC